MLHLRHGVLRPPRGADLAERLNFLHRELLAIVVHEAPEIAVVERVFIAANPRSALVLGQARGAILASLGAAGVPVAELAARQVKKAVTGSGATGKAQMQMMVAKLLSLDVAPPTDAADALALAFTYAGAGPLAGLPIRSRRRNTRRATTRFILEKMR
jgi:crossover junction endodeoxyribonuclease RuvC